MAKGDDVTTEDLRENLIELRKDFKELLGTVERLAAAQASGVSSQVHEGLRAYADKGEEMFGMVQVVIDALCLLACHADRAGPRLHYRTPDPP
jgi:hypothetical protein